MKAEVEKPNDLSGVKERLKKLRSEHKDDLERMYDRHAEDYLNEVMDRYGSKPETPLTDPPAVKALASLVLFLPSTVDFFLPY